MVITKRGDVTKQGSCKLLWRAGRGWGGEVGRLFEFECEGRGGEVGRLFEFECEGRGWGGGRRRLFEVGRLLTFSTFRLGGYSRWALIRDWALIRINTV